MALKDFCRTKTKNENNKKIKHKKAKHQRLKKGKKVSQARATDFNRAPTKKQLNDTCILFFLILVFKNFFVYITDAHSHTRTHP